MKYADGINATALAQVQSPPDKSLYQTPIRFESSAVRIANLNTRFRLGADVEVQQVGTQSGADLRSAVLSVAAGQPASRPAASPQLFPTHQLPLIGSDALRPLAIALQSPWPVSAVALCACS